MADSHDDEHDYRDVPGEVGHTVEQVVEGASGQVEVVAEKLEEAADKASEAAREATTPHEHEVLAGVGEALHLLRAELKRANDLREFEQNQAEKVVEENAATAVAPVAEVVEGPKPKYVRRGARKVKK